MALQISECRGVFSVHGSLHSGNAAILRQHLSAYFVPQKPIILNLGRVKSIDRQASLVLTQLHAFALRKNILLSIIGKENQEILPVMQASKTSYILSNDHF